MTFTKINYDKLKRVALIAACIALAAQVSYPVYTQGFVITFSVLLLPIFLYLNDDLHPLSLSAGIAIASPIFLSCLMILSGESSLTLILRSMVSDALFYLIYGLIYYLLYWHRLYQNITAFFCTIVVCDYLSNFVEISYLMRFSGYSMKMFRLLFIIALVRSLIACGIAFCYHYIHLMVRKEEHEQRYYYFLWSASAVKSQIYFMRKNTAEIERIMKNAYLLNKELDHKFPGSQQSKTALGIARDVHEIKKDYQNIMASLGSYFEQENDQTMKLSEILQLVTHYGKTLVRKRDLDIMISSVSQIDFPIKDHYYLVSILSNLMTNSIEAMEPTGEGFVHIIVEIIDQNIQIKVEDNGPGIPPDVKALIFTPGFSTKFNQKTGDVYRGIGLSNVVTIVEEEFGGKLSVETEVNKGTQFIVTINKNKLGME